MYKYCLDYENIKSKIQEDINNVKKAAKEAINKTKEVSKESVVDLYDGTFIYKSLLNESLERVDPDQKSTEKVENKDDNKKEESKPSDNYQSTEKGKTDDINKEKVQNSGGEDATSKKIRIYLNVSCDILSAKLKVHEEMYNKFMAIMRAHVKDHKKNTGNEDNNSSNDNKENNQKNNQETKENLDNASKAIDSI